MVPVTALMITRGRVEMVSQAVADYQRQTYPHRQLLIITDGTREEFKQLGSITRSDNSIGVVHVQKPGVPLGDLRNIALTVSPTDWTMQWDDDDWYHPARMEEQVAGIRPGKASVYLQEQLHYRRDTGEVAWVYSPGGIEGTALYNKAAGFRYPTASRGEDTVLYKALLAAKQVVTIRGGNRYCRTYHGTNTWDLAHHQRRMLRMGHLDSVIQARRDELLEAASVYPWRSDWRAVPGERRS